MSKRFVVAVSGGVDSVVLLDFLYHLPHEQIVVAHFDHGIRPESADDARFVEGLAQKYNLTFEMVREELGEGASEELARKRRYAFLRHLARRYDAQLATAHHADDVVETIAINLSRGTGWRGVAVLSDTTITRPLLHKWKSELQEYATQKRLEWVEDATNSTDAYLRNQLRHAIARSLPLDDKRQIHALWSAQTTRRLAVDNELVTLAKNSAVYSRYFISMISLSEATEVVRAMILQAARTTVTRPQLEMAVMAIRVARRGSTHRVAKTVIIVCEKQTWSVQVV